MSQPVAEENTPSLSILLPVRDETINLKVMLKLLTSGVDISHELLVIYDNPNDLSVPVVQQLQSKFDNLHLVPNNLGKGVPNALRAGVSAAKGQIILIVCADDVGPVLALDDMIQLIENGCEFVSGTRYVTGGRRLGGSMIGGLLSRTANWLLCSIGGCAFSDATTGLKMFKKEVFGKLKLKSRPIGWVVALEMALRAQLIGLKLGEVPIISVDRLYGGKSTFQFGPWFVEYLRLFLWGIVRLRNHPAKVMTPADITSINPISSIKLP